LTSSDLLPNIADEHVELVGLIRLGHHSNLAQETNYPQWALSFSSSAASGKFRHSRSSNLTTAASYQIVFSLLSLFFMKLGMYIMTPEHISTAYFINRSHRSIARQRLGKHVPVAANTRSSGRIVGLIVFYMVRVVSNESLWVCYRC
jgi:hypothetical protein